MHAMKRYVTQRSLISIKIVQFGDMIIFTNVEKLTVNLKKMADETVPFPLNM